jgi:RNA-binding protein Nova
MLKTMVPNHIAGSIIGKKGQTIQILQEQTGAKLKLSSANEFYPGTAERVVVILGELHQILAMLDLVTEKIRSELPGRGGGSLTPERCNMIKLIIPNSTAGMVIGKGGCFIRGITEDTGAKLQISQKDLEISGERVITITGEHDQVKAAAAAVVTKCQDDAEHGLNTNLIYSGFGRNKPGFSHTGASTSMAGALGNLSTLLGLGGGSHDSSNSNLLAQASMLASNSLGSNQLGNNPLATANPLSAMLGMQQLGGSSPANAITTTATYEMSVPDHLVGIILGKGGKTLNEFMQFSNAVITISHKGEFITGTSNRKVVITGDPTSVQTAYFLITQKIIQEAPKLGSTFT